MTRTSGHNSAPSIRGTVGTTHQGSPGLIRSCRWEDSRAKPWRR